MAELTASEAEATESGLKNKVFREGLPFSSAALMGLTLYLVFFWVPTPIGLWGVSHRIF